MHCIRNLMFDICAIAVKSFVFIHYLLVDTYFKKMTIQSMYSPF